MARIKGQRWLVGGKLLNVYDAPECPVCGQFDKVVSKLELQQNSLIPGCNIKHWDICECKRCDKSYVSFMEFSSTDEVEYSE